MGIIKFLPPLKKVKDFRNNPNGHYEAVCEHCSTPFFPKRSTALYCTPNCAYQHRKGKPTSKKIATKNPDIKTLSSNVKSITYTKSVYEFLSERHNTKQKKGAIMKSLIALKIGEDLKFETSSIRKVGAKKYEVTFL